MITRIHEAEPLVKHISCDCKCKFNSTTYNSNQKWSKHTCQCECKKYQTCKKDSNWNPSTCISENSKFLKSIGDTSVIVCDEIINATDSVSKNVTNTMPTNMTNIISTNVPNTVSINSDDKKLRYKTNCYIFHVLLVIILLFTIAIICYHYAKRSSAQNKSILAY